MQQNFCTFCHESEDEYCNMDFTPDELLQIKEQYIKLNKLNRCPFCYAEADSSMPISVDFRHATSTFECIECGAAWRNHYDLKDVDIMRIPSRLTLCCQCDRLIYDAIDRLKEYGEEHLSERLHKLFTGGFRHAMV